MYIWEHLPPNARTKTVPQIYALVDGTQDVVLATLRLQSEAHAMLGALNRVDVLALYRALRAHFGPQHCSCCQNKTIEIKAAAACFREIERQAPTLTDLEHEAHCGALIDDGECDCVLLPLMEALNDE